MSSLSPRADDDFIGNVLASLRKRHKALRHQVRDLKVEQIVERGEEGDRRKLEIDCTLASRLTLRLFVWEDRWVWFDTRQGSKADGWIWSYTWDGRLFGGDAARRLEDALEASIAATFGMSPSDLARFADIWAPILARGPGERGAAR